MKRLVKEGIGLRVKIKELKEIMREYSDNIIDEMAVPSYGHWNPLIKWLMWKRLTIVQNLCSEGHFKTALDYGTGTGVMLPFLSEIADHVIALDKFIAPATRLCERYRLNNVELHEIDTLPIPLPNESTDLILCLDVLEHISALAKATEDLTRILKPGGTLIVSGPSENALYRFGRWVAGFNKRATYHCWNIDDVNKALRMHLSIIQQRTLLGPVRLFEINVFQKLPSDGPPLSESQESYETLC